MRVAEARYTGRMRRQTFRVPSGEITLRRSRSGSDWTPIEDAEDAEFLEGKNTVEVRWSGIGKLRSLLEPAEDAISAFAEMGFQAKRSLASELGLEFEGTPDSDTLDEELANHVKELQERGEL